MQQELDHQHNVNVIWLSLVGAATSIFFVATKVLSWQTCYCDNKCVCCDKTCLLLRQNCLLGQNFCCDKLLLFTFVAIHVTKIFCHNKHNFVMTKLLPQQAGFCCNKRRVLSWQTRVCHNKTFVMTRMILLAAPANDTWQLVVTSHEMCLVQWWLVMRCV